MDYKVVILKYYKQYKWWVFIFFIFFRIMLNAFYLLEDCGQV